MYAKKQSIRFWWVAIRVTIWIQEFLRDIYIVLIQFYSPGDSTSVGGGLCF